MSLPGEAGTTTSQFIEQLQSQDAIVILNLAITGPPQGVLAGPHSRSAPMQLAPDAQAQLAIEVALAEVVHVPSGDLAPGAALTVPVADAAHRFADLGAGTRRAWLVTHLAALRAGRITISEIP
jgi:hypothetical protein